MQGNMLSLNVAKTKSLLIGTKPRHNNRRSADMELSLNQGRGNGGARRAMAPTF